MKASVVVRTYGRPEVAAGLLASLNKQEYNDFEVILVCQGEKEDFEKIKDSINTVYPLRYYYEARPSAPGARNAGIKQAQGEIVIFLDDDEEPDNDLIKAHLANYTDSSVGIVGGKVLEDSCEKDIPDSKIGMIRKFDAREYGGFRKDVRRENVMHVKGGNMSVRKDVAEEVGGFDERFEGTAEYEEFDFCLQVLKRGYKIVYDPAAVIKHLALPFGGSKTYTKTKEERMYWLCRNHSLAFLSNFNKLFYPVFIAEYIIRIIRYSFIWRNAKIAASSFKGMGEAWRVYRGSKRKGL